MRNRGTDLVVFRRLYNYDTVTDVSTAGLPTNELRPPLPTHGKGQRQGYPQTTHNNNVNDSRQLLRPDSARSYSNLSSLSAFSHLILTTTLSSGPFSHFTVGETEAWRC